MTFAEGFRFVRQRLPSPFTGRNGRRASGAGGSEGGSDPVDCLSLELSSSRLVITSPGPLRARVSRLSASLWCRPLAIRDHTPRQRKLNASDLPVVALVAPDGVALVARTYRLETGSVPCGSCEQSEQTWFKGSLRPPAREFSGRSVTFPAITPLSNAINPSPPSAAGRVRSGTALLAVSPRG
jgi:hypothetical protein